MTEKQEAARRRNFMIYVVSGALASLGWVRLWLPYKYEATGAIWGRLESAEQELLDLLALLRAWDPNG